MLADEKNFGLIEQALIEAGKIEAFEKRNGPIKGHMMILPVDIPETVEYKKIPGKTPIGFEATFDFYNSAIGIALYIDTMTVASRVWITPQVEGAEAPAEEWVEFFIEKLAQGIDDDGSFGYPMCSFVTDEADMTLVPADSSWKVPR